MIELHVTYTMKPGIQPKAFYDALNAATIPETCRQEKAISVIIIFFLLTTITSSFCWKYGKIKTV